MATQGAEAPLGAGRFRRPAGFGRHDYLGAFAVTTGQGIEPSSWPASTPITTITTRSWSRRWPIGWPRHLPSACTQQRGADWGYGDEEHLTNDELIAEKYRGIRPAPGYPACPDHTEKRTLFDLLDAERAAGIQLTESVCHAAGRQRERSLLRPSRRPATSPSTASIATRSKTTPAARE